MAKTTSESTKKKMLEVERCKRWQIHRSGTWDNTRDVQNLLFNTASRHACGSQPLFSHHYRDAFTNEASTLRLLPGFPLEMQYPALYPRATLSWEMSDAPGLNNFKESIVILPEGESMFIKDKSKHGKFIYADQVYDTRQTNALPKHSPS
jgi:hypothetical protein